VLVEPIEDWEEFFERVRKAEAEADGAVQPWQEALKVGDCFVRLWDPYGAGANPLAIYGHIDELKYQEDRDLYAGEEMKHHRPCTCYSQMCPEGEFGDVHISTVAGILPRPLFDFAKAHGWPSVEVLQDLIAMKKADA